MPRLVFLSDTHMQLSRIPIPDGDLLVHCGDLTFMGTLPEMAKELKALGQAAKKFKACYFVCGNHDWLGERDPSLLRMLAGENGLVWLQQELAEFGGLKIWGSAYTPEFCGWAFGLSRMDGSLTEAWSEIPDTVDVLVTHGPPKGILDNPRSRIGCTDLLDRVMKVKPKVHAFGHCHWDYGEKIFEGVHFINAASCDERYMPVNPPVVVDL